MLCVIFCLVLLTYITPAEPGNYSFETSDAVVIEALDSFRSRRQLRQTEATSSGNNSNHPVWSIASLNDCTPHYGSSNGICVTLSVCRWIQLSLGRPVETLSGKSLTECRVERGKDGRSQSGDFVGVCCPGIQSPQSTDRESSVRRTDNNSGGTQSAWWQTTRGTSSTTASLETATQWWQRPTTSAATPESTSWWQTTTPGSAPVAVTQWWQTTTTPASSSSSTASRQKDSFYSCGTRNFEADRIVGGQEASQGEFPWIAGIYKRGRHFCGGSLIDEEHILTAAHCVASMTSYDVSQLTIRLGDHDKSTPFESEHRTFKVKRVVRHKGFTTAKLYDDIALITLAEKVQFASNIRPICLARGDREYTGRVATVAGWGSLREGGRQPNILMKVTINVWKNSDCAASYGRQAPGGIISSMLCAGREGKDSCSGDSGGPLMMVENRVVYQIGVVSWGIGCGKVNYPGVYTRVNKLIDWVERNRRKY